LLVVDRAVAPTDGSVVVAVVDGAFALKRIGRDPAGRLALAPARQESAAIRLSDPALELWGVVCWAVHRVWPGRQAA
jgi:DNA polymerase V